MKTRSRRPAAWLLSALLSASTCWAGKNVWTPIGPWGEYVDSLALDPNNSTTLYAGTLKGFFKTTDGGASWTLVNGARLSFGPASFDPQNPGTIYAGLGFGTAPMVDPGC